MASHKKSRAQRKKQPSALLSSEAASLVKKLQAASRKKKLSATEKNNLARRHDHFRQQLEELAVKAKIVDTPKAPMAGPPGPARALFGAPTSTVAAASDDDQIGTQFQEFLAQVGAAMVSAQQQLDSESRRYLTGTVPSAMPSMFRLPRLSAKVQFDFSKTTGSDLNFVFFRDKDTTNDSRQHLLDFEIVAVPPPPGFNPAVPGWRLLTGSERTNALAAMHQGPDRRFVLWELTIASKGLIFLLANAPSPVAGQPAQASLSVIGPTNVVLQTIQFQPSVDPKAPTFQIIAGLQDLADKQVALGG